jgi:hypothetical protein
MSFTDREPDPEELRQWMISIHMTAKPSFLSLGLMLGEFFPNHSATGVRSDAFNPLRSPVPLFVIRAMVPLDMMFLSERKEYARAYFAKFGEESIKHVRDILNISPKRLAPSRLRALLQCLRWYDLQNTSVDGRDLVTGALLKDVGQSKLQRLLDQDRTFRPLVTTVVLQPRGLGKDLESESLEHLAWLWHTAHLLRRVAGTEDFAFRDGGRLVVVLSTSNPAEVQRVAQICESGDYLDGSLGTTSGWATEGVRQAHAEEWEWDGTQHTSGLALLDSAYEDLFRRDTARNEVLALF